MWADLDEFNNPSIGAPTTPEGRTLSTHAQESLPRHGFEEPYSKVDEIIDNASRQTSQEDGATVYIQANRDGTYNIAIVNEQEGTVVTAMQNLEPRELRQLGQNYGFDPNP